MERQSSCSRTKFHDGQTENPQSLTSCEWRGDEAREDVEKDLFFLQLMYCTDYQVWENTVLGIKLIISSRKQPSLVCLSAAMSITAADLKRISRLDVYYLPGLPLTQRSSKILQYQFVMSCPAGRSESQRIVYADPYPFVWVDYDYSNPVRPNPSQQSPKLTLAEP